MASNNEINKGIMIGVVTSIVAGIIVVLFEYTFLVGKDQKSSSTSKQQQTTTKKIPRVKVPSHTPKQVKKYQKPKPKPKKNIQRKIQHNITICRSKLLDQMRRSVEGKLKGSFYYDFRLSIVSQEQENIPVGKSPPDKIRITINYKAIVTLSGQKPPVKFPKYLYSIGELHINHQNGYITFSVVAANYGNK